MIIMAQQAQTGIFTRREQRGRPISFHFEELFISLLYVYSQQTTTIIITVKDEKHYVIFFKSPNKRMGL